MSISGSQFFGKFLNSRRFLPLMFFLAISLEFISLPNFDAFAQGDLLITPRRLVFEGSKKSLNINLANTGTDSATYAISLVQIRMKEDGYFETITKPDSGQQFADRFLRFFPRSVTLAPGEAQLVKVQLIRTNELQTGEYRSHFYFRSVPKLKPLGEEKTVEDTTMMSVKLVPVFGITIAAIIRVGESSAKVSLSDLKLDLVSDTVPKLSMVFTRSGNMSVYGDVEVSHISSQGKKTNVGLAKGVAVYTPNIIRLFQLNLAKVPGIDFKTGKIQVTFTSNSDINPTRYADSELILN
jgi:P pilus assembly chaperone PapD